VGPESRKIGVLFPADIAQKAYGSGPQSAWYFTALNDAAEVKLSDFVRKAAN
jgi:hypothetical protein